MVDPTLQYCNCGFTFRPGLYHKLLMLLFNSYSWRCPKCGTKLKFKLVHHVVKVDTVSIKNREKVWRNG